MSRGVIRSRGAYISDLTGIAARTPVNQQARRGLKGKPCEDGFCTIDLSVQQVRCQFDNLFRTPGHNRDSRRRYD